MHCRPRNIIILSLIFMFTHASLQAQQVRVKAGVDRTTILIGEQLKLNLEATVPAGTN